MSAPAPRFCPFCHECFDGASECPDHGVALVPFEALPLARAAVPSDEDAVSAYDLRFGRGGVFLGAGVQLLGFVLPFVSRDGTVRSALEMAVEMATNLWTVPAVASAQVLIVLRRRSLPEMRGARAALPSLSLLVFGSTAFTHFRVEQGAEHLRRAYEITVDVEVLSGSWVMVAGATVAGVAGAMLGRTRG